MNRITSLDLSPFYRNSVGIDRFMENMQSRLLSANAGNYPPYNIIAVDQHNYRIEIAVAGFVENEIDVHVDANQLIIAGAQKSEPEESLTFVHRGIGTRAFTRNFELAEHVEVTSAAVENGILSINLQQIVPEELKPTKININFGK